MDAVLAGPKCLYRLPSFRYVRRGRQMVERMPRFKIVSSPPDIAVCAASGSSSLVVLVTTPLGQAARKQSRLKDRTYEHRFQLR